MADPIPTRAISIRQPWAWLIAHGHKDIENRTWVAHHRGPFWIHAGKTFDREGYEWVRATFPDLPMPHHLSFRRGGIVGRAILADVVEQSDSPWFFGPAGFVLEDARPVRFMEVRGQLGFFRLDEHELKAAREALVEEDR